MIHLVSMMPHFTRPMMLPGTHIVARPEDHRMTTQFVLPAPSNMNLVNCKHLPAKFCTCRGYNELIPPELSPTFKGIHGLSQGKMEGIQKLVAMLYYVVFQSNKASHLIKKNLEKKGMLWWWGSKHKGGVEP